MNRRLDLADIQGNIVRPYGRFGFPFTRHMFFGIAEARAGRRFVEQVRHRVTTSVRWGAIDGDPDPQAPARPEVAINIGFSFTGLLALELPTRTLSRMPEEFIDGMTRRWSILGDIGPSLPTGWDPIWRPPEGATEHRRGTGPVHVWVSLNAATKADGTASDALLETTAWLQTTALELGGVTLLGGHSGPNPLWQDAVARMVQAPDGSMMPIAKEHFGFTDGIADPTFAGQYEPAEEAEEVIGAGKLIPGQPGWSPLAAGEFVLGHAGEAQELPVAAPPWSFTRNGTFMVYRKLHENIGTFDSYVAAQAETLRALSGLDSLEAARETIMAKMVGRWSSGFPLAVAHSYAEAQRLAADYADIPARQAKGPAKTPEDIARIAEFERLLTDFHYSSDPAGTTCPVASHIRRVNPRDSLDPEFGKPGALPDTALTNRRRIMRRGAPYGDSTVRDDAGDHGVIFMAICSSIFRQFEFIQQQWVQYGASFNVGNDTDPLVGLRRKGAKFVIAADGTKGEMPFICTNLPAFIETRGGEYFFLPSLTALREIAEGSVDPT